MDGPETIEDYGFLKAIGDAPSCVSTDEEKTQPRAAVPHANRDAVIHFRTPPKLGHPAT
jgi:hypothetical protein